MERDIYYKISKEKLIELFAAYEKLCALENGGVDDWEWYSCTINDYLNSYKMNSFEEFAEAEIKNLPIVTVYHIDNYEIPLMENEANYKDFTIDMKEEKNELE